MFSPSEQIQQPSPRCSWCYGVGKLSRCGRCANAYYCCKEHQVQHWKFHRNDCKPSANVDSKSTVIPDTVLQLSSAANVVDDLVNIQTADLSRFASEMQQPTYSGWLGDTVEESSLIAPSTQITTYPSTEYSPNMYAASECTLPTLPPQSVLCQANETSNLDSFYAAAATSDLEDKIFTESNADVFSSLSSELLSSTNNYWDLIDNSNTENFAINYNLDLSNVKPLDDRVIESSLDNLNLVPMSNSSSTSENRATNNNQMDDNTLLKEICLNIVADLNKFGICVIDDFLGHKIGDLISAEVKSMFLTGMFKKGELVNPGTLLSTQNIRGDVITWVSGSESGCHYIGTLIKKLDFVMAACNKMPKNGVLSNYKLNRRTRAMIACYPGDGTHYKKHIDNPNNDGRCITCIYYLNKKWDTKSHGGLLRMFPAGNEDEVANIEPIFDRMLFFWSDKRNPHEVLPSYAVRFAITVWYFDSDERDRALQKSKELTAE